MESNAREMLGVLNAFNVDYLVVGGVALQAHGMAHVTNDVDIVIAPGPENHEPLGKALEALGAEQRAVGTIGQRFRTRLGNLDVLDYTEGRGDYEAWSAGAQDVQLGEGGPVVQIGSLEDIKYDKTLIDREKDREALELIARFERGDVEPTPAELLLGPRPAEPAARQRWDLVERMLDRFREDHAIDTPEPLGGALEDQGALDQRQQILRLADQVMAAPDLGEPGLDGASP